MKYSYTIQRTGAIINRTLSRDAALARLAFLDKHERVVAESSPTNSGDVRTNYLAEARAIRAALAVGSRWGLSRDQVDAAENMAPELFNLLCAYAPPS